jgi:hypothetical protein
MNVFIAAEGIGNDVEVFHNLISSARLSVLR